MPVDENQPDEVGSEPIAAELPKSHRALSRLKRELTDDELGSSGVQKMLLELLQRAEDDNADLTPFREKYHLTDKQNGVLNEKLKSRTAADVVSMGSLAVGAAALGYAPSVWASQPTGWIALAFGILLTLVGIAARVARQ
jgi:hypothetical protein